MITASQNSMISVYSDQLIFNQDTYRFISFEKIQKDFPNLPIDQLPFSLRVLLESQIRHASTPQEIEDTVTQFCNYLGEGKKDNVSIYPTRVLLQDYTGIPVLVDLCALREVTHQAGHSPSSINPVIPVDLVVDHSVVVNSSGSKEAFEKNSSFQFQENLDRFVFLKWTAKAFKNLRIIPPDSGICHQVNLESLATGIVTDPNEQVIYPEFVLGADSHTPTINSIGVLGWGVGGIEALGAALGESLEIPLPEVVGVFLHGELASGVTATDCVLTLTALLRKHGVVNKIIEFTGPGAKTLSVPDRATITNMAPEYGATCAFFPWDQQTLHYFAKTSRSNGELLKHYAQQAKFWQDETTPIPKFNVLIDLNLNEVMPTLAGPKKPEQRLLLPEVPTSYQQELSAGDSSLNPSGKVFLAAITSCTNTANPELMISAGLLAKKAVERGLEVPEWVKTLFAPGSLTVASYLQKSGLQTYLDQLGFHICAFGCTACIGNSGGLLPQALDLIAQTKDEGCAVLSGNRNFSGRVQQQIRMNYLASPPLVIAYALAGTVLKNLATEPIARRNNQDIFLRDLWPSRAEIMRVMEDNLQPQLFLEQRKQLGIGSEAWTSLEVKESELYDWPHAKAFVAKPPFFFAGKASEKPSLEINHAPILLLLGDGVTTDDISPAGKIGPTTRAGHFLAGQGVDPKDYHTFGSRRGNWEVMLQGAFTNPNLKNFMHTSTSPGLTKNIFTGEVNTVYDVAADYQERGLPSVIIAGKNYGTGSSRDDAARSTRLLGVKVVIAQSYERIHRSNLCAFGILPLLFTGTDDRLSLNLQGDERITIHFGKQFPTNRQSVECVIENHAGKRSIRLESALFAHEKKYFVAGGVMPYLKSKFVQ
jgi:aconitate hydratase